MADDPPFLAQYGDQSPRSLNDRLGDIPAPTGTVMAHPYHEAWIRHLLQQYMPGGNDVANALQTVVGFGPMALMGARVGAVPSMRRATLDEYGFPNGALRAPKPWAPEFVGPPDPAFRWTPKYSQEGVASAPTPRSALEEMLARAEATSARREASPSPQAIDEATLRERGFDTSRPWFHGTTQKFNTFDNAAARATRGRGQGAGDFGNPMNDEAHFLAAERWNAEDYLGAVLNGDNGRILGSYVRPGKQKVLDYDPSVRPADAQRTMADLLRKAREDGYDTALIKEYAPELDELAVFDPRNIHIFDHNTKP